MGLFDSNLTRSAFRGRLTTGKRIKCVQTGCDVEPSGSGIRTMGGVVHACSRHKLAFGIGVGGSQKKVNKFAAAQKAEERKLRAQERRQRRVDQNTD